MPRGRPTTAKQRKEKQKAKGRRQQNKTARTTARESKKEKVPEKSIRLHDSGGNTAYTSPNAGLGNCSLLSLINLRDVASGVSRDAVISSTTGNLPPPIKRRVQQLREDIVKAADGHPLCSSLLDNGEKEPRSFDDIVYDTKSDYDIKTLAMFKAVTVCPDGYLGWRAVMVGAEILGLDGLKIVTSDESGKLVFVYGEHESTEGIPMIRFYSWGHYEAVYVPPVSLVEEL